jgi:histone demethylase JARID1
LAQYGFIPGERHTRASLERYSRYFRKTYFSRDGVPADVTVRDLEGEFWRLVETSNGESEEVEVIYGADIATLEVGSGFTAKDDPCVDAPAQRAYADSPWNVCNMPYNDSSCLKHVEATTGITVPWLYFGMTLSTFCWHVEDHHFYSVNYHHFGDPKVWYSIPAEYSAKFEEVMRRRLPHLFAAQPDLLHSLVTIMSPAALKEEGIPVYRAEQHPRSYIITFPHAYHAGFNTGFNCAEAVNFAPVDWLPFGAVATERYVRDTRYQSVAHDQLLATLCDAAETQPAFCPTVARVMAERVAVERARRDAATPARVAKTARMAGTDAAPDLFEKDCAVCQADLNWAGVRCECKPKRVYCLRCVRECACKPERSTLFFRHTAEELDAKCARLAELARRHEDAEAAARAAAPVTTVAEEWIACDACEKWRRVPAALARALGEDQKWTCAQNPRPAFASCDAPEERMRENETWDEAA